MSKSDSILIALETTGLNLGVGIYRAAFNGPYLETLAEYFKPAQAQQAELLIPTLSKLLKKLRLNKAKIDFIAVDNGPGSFTGVRVGVAAARGLAQGLEIPLVGVSSLTALAREKMPLLKAGRKAIVVSLPASTTDVYFAAYDQRLQLLCKPQWTTNDNFVKAKANLKNKKYELIETTGLPHPRWIAELGAEKYFSSESRHRFRYDTVSPMYLQPTWAERSRKK
jgi:tRNA threonylcarbamoyl adenosine modification protein YeaZ